MNKKLATILSPAIIGGMIFSISAVAIAGTTTDQKIQGQQVHGEGHGRMGGQFKGQIGRGINNDLAASLVKEGIITQEVADKITAYMEEKNTERKAEMEKIKAMSEDERKAYFENQKSSTTESIEKKADWLSEMLTSGVLTQEQVDSIKAYNEKQRQVMQEEQKTKRQEQITTGLDGLVSAGTITEDLKGTIIEYLDTQEETRNAEMEKVKAMSDDERKAYLESKKDTFQDTAKGMKFSPLNALVDEGTLTQDQADAVAKVLFHGPARKK